MLKRICLTSMVLIPALFIFSQLLAWGCASHRVKDQPADADKRLDMTDEEQNKEIEELIEKLGDNNWRIREHASKKLAEIGRPAVKRLKEALNHQDLEIKLRADRILSQIGDLIACWKLDETSGTIARDSSGNNNNGILHGAKWVAGKTGGALSFDGVRDYVEVPDAPPLNYYPPLGAECWVKIPDFPDGGAIILNKGQSWALHISDNHYQADMAGLTPQQIHSRNVIPLNTWVHLALTYDGKTVKLYENGVETASQTVTGKLDSDSDSFMIGANSPNPYGADPDKRPYLFKGFMAEVKIYNYIRTAAEIQSDYKAILPKMSAN
ncbi:MAG: LamG-like jellyroll fold domain-containing protein [Planctomycetota bacterium]